MKTGIPDYKPYLHLDRYYLKDFDITVADIYYDKDYDLFTMDVLRPDLFTDRLDKIWFTDKAFRRWYDRRLTPEYQQGYEEKMESFGLDINDPNHRWELFILARGCNAKDYLWIAFSEEETYKSSSPWHQIRKGWVE